MANYPPYVQPNPVYPQVYQPWQNRYQQPVSYQPQPVVQPMPIQPVVRMVTSKEEAVATQIDFNPSVINLFVDLAHGMIYTKRFNANTGAADYDDYKLIVPEQAPIQQPVQQTQPVPVQPQQPPVEYVTVDTFRSLEGRVNEIGNAVAQWQTIQQEQVQSQPKKAAPAKAAKEE